MQIFKYGGTVTNMQSIPHILDWIFTSGRLMEKKMFLQRTSEHLQLSLKNVYINSNKIILPPAPYALRMAEQLHI